jgi:hemin uptake protein HemP
MMAANDLPSGEAISTGFERDMNGRTADGTNRPPAARIAVAKAKVPPPKDVPRLDAGTLLAGSRECIIVHHDSEYRLRITSNGKLILTK